MREEKEISFYGLCMGLIFGAIGIWSTIRHVKEQIPFIGGNINTWLGSIILTIAGIGMMGIFLYCIYTENKKD